MIIETQIQITSWLSEILDCKNRISFLKQTLIDQLESMRTNSDYNEEDCAYLQNIIDSI